MTTATTLTQPGGTHQDHSRAHAFLDGVRRLLLMVFFWFGLPIVWAYAFMVSATPRTYLETALAYAVAYAIVYALFRLHPFRNYLAGEGGEVTTSAPAAVPTSAPAPAPAPAPVKTVAPAPAPAGPAAERIDAAFGVHTNENGVVTAGVETTSAVSQPEAVEVIEISAFQLGSRAEKSLTKASSHLAVITELLKSRRDNAQNLFELFEVLEQYRKAKDNIEKAASEFQVGVNAGCDVAVLLPIVERIEKYEGEIAGLAQTIAKALENAPVASTVTSTERSATPAPVAAAIGLEDDPKRLNERIEQIRALAGVINEFDRLQAEFPEPSKEAVEVSTLVVTAQVAQEQAEKAIQNGLIKVVQAAETKDPVASKAVITGAKGSLSLTASQFELAEQAVETIDGLMQGGDTSALEEQLESAQSNVRDLNRRVVDLQADLLEANARGTTVAPAAAATSPAPRRSATPRASKPGGRRYPIASSGAAATPDPEDD